MIFGMSEYGLPEPTAVYEGAGPVQQAAPPLRERPEKPKGRGKQHMRRVYVADLDETFPSVKEAAEAIGVARSTLANALARGGHSIGEHTFRYAD